MVDELYVRYESDNSLERVTEDRPLPVWVVGPEKYPLNSTTAALAASSIVKASPGRLLGVTVTNTKASPQYIQVFDSRTLPVDTTVPIMSVAVAANSALFLDWGLQGRRFIVGIVVCNSSTDATKTIGSADCLFDAQYV